MKTDDGDLDDLFAEARAEALRPAPAALSARVLVDAKREMPKPRGTQTVLRARRGWFGFRSIEVAGLLGAGVAGLMIGFVAPNLSEGLADSLTADSGLSDLMAGLDSVLAEGEAG